MKSPNTKSSSELQREVRSEINNLKRDVESLQGRLTPGQILDDAIFYPRGKSLSATFDHLKRNPVGTAFLSLGTILLMEDENHSTYETLAKNKVTTMKDSINTVKNTVKNQLPHKNLEPGMAPNKADRAKGKIRDMKANVTAKAAKLRGTLNDAVDKVDIEATKLKVKDKLSTLDPMAYLALGASLGALTGAALPISEKEQALVQSKFQDKISSFSKDLEGAINECSNILKDLVINDAKSCNVNLFKS